MWTILGWIIIGLIGGAIAKAIVPGKQGGGWLATILLGIAGAVVAGLIGSLIFDGKLDISGPSFSLGGLLTSIIGAIIIIVVWGLINKKKS